MATKKVFVEIEMREAWDDDRFTSQIRVYDESTEEWIDEVAHNRYDLPETFEPYADFELFPWSHAKDHAHDSEGIDAPENVMWRRIHGIFYPTPHSPKRTIH